MIFLNVPDALRGTKSVLCQPGSEPNLKFTAFQGSVNEAFVNPRPQTSTNLVPTTYADIRFHLVWIQLVIEPSNM
jgi:hypothetical protein